MPETPEHNPNAPAEFTTSDLVEIIDPGFLEHLAEASGGFTYRVVSEVSIPPQMRGHMGFTDMQTRVIYLVREQIAPKLKDPNFRRQMKGFLAHEAGHHAPWVVTLDKKLRDKIGNEAYDPAEFDKEFKMDAEKEIREERMPLRQLFWRAVHPNVYNVALDIWLESYMARSPFLLLRGDYLALYEFATEKPRDFFSKMPYSHQFTQWLVGEERYLQITKRQTRRERERHLIATEKEVLDPRVAKEVDDFRSRGVIRALMDVSAWESFNAAGREQENSVAQKEKATMEYLLPSWVKMLNLDLDQKCEEYWQENPKPQREEGESDESWQKRQIDFNKEHAPKFERFRYEALRILLGDAIQSGGEAYGVESPDVGGEAETEAKMGSIKPCSGKSDQPTHKIDPQKDSDAERRRMMNERMGEMRRQKLEEDADRFGVSPEAVAEMNRLEREYAKQIQELAEHLAEAFLSQRRAVRDFHHLEGQLTPGMESFVKAEASRGKMDVYAYERTIKAPEFTSTDVEILVDSSGSMQGGRLEIGRALVLVIQRAFERVRSILEDEMLLNPEDEEPLRVGYAGFTSSPYRIKKLSEPLETKSLAQMIKMTSERTGGTDDASAIEALVSEFRVDSEAAIKFLIIVSDGEGNPGAVQNLMEELEKTEDMIVIVCGIGSNANEVLKTYGSSARAAGITNVLPITGDSVNEALPQIAKYIHTYITKKNEQFQVE